MMDFVARAVARHPGKTAALMLGLAIWGFGIETIVAALLIFAVMIVITLIWLDDHDDWLDPPDGPRPA